MLRVDVDDKEVVIRISAEYLKNSAECGLTTGGEKTVTDEKEMLRYYAEAIVSRNDDSRFNRCIDSIAQDACEHGESWVSWDSE